MNSLRIEAHNAAALLLRFREGLMSTSKRQRKMVFHGLRDALKGLGLVSSKEPIQTLFEGIDSNGDHWFMAEVSEGEKLKKPPPLSPASEAGGRPTLSEASTQELASIAKLACEEAAMRGGSPSLSDFEKAFQGARARFFTIEDYAEVSSVAQALRLQAEGQDPYFNGLAERLTNITSRVYAGG